MFASISGINIFFQTDLTVIKIVIRKLALYFYLVYNSISVYFPNNIWKIKVIE